MKLSRFGRTALASVVSLGLGFGVVACGPANTIDFLYVTSSKQNPGQINVYKVDSQVGALLPLNTSPYSSGGADPVADAASPNGKNLYVVNHDSSTIVVFAISTDGTITQQQSCSVPGSLPTQVAINKAGTYLYVVETYQPNYSANTPGPGAVVVYPINDTGQLGASSNSCTPVANGSNSFFPAGNNPVAVNVTANGNYVYAVNESDATISAFQVGSSGALTSNGTFPVGVAPNAIASDPTSKFLYITDGAANQLIGFLIQTNGTLIAMQTPFKTDILPNSVQVDTRGIYVYVANYGANDVSAYTIDRATGNATQIAGTTTYSVDAGPTCILIEPAEARYVYTTNFLGSTVSGLSLNPATGALAPVQNTPFRATGQPTCSAAIAHGNHAIEIIQP
ncbi:MAG TPA: beta-propeller fold lactonase family protein [Acidobacteriaceae bacterium]|nr:beta-propeller fold lactonase family protein [Acidobacteriaceae bacterium]